MMKKIRYLCILLLLSYYVNAQTAGDILKRFVDSSGGAERISRINTSHFQMRSVSNHDTSLIIIIKEKGNRYATILKSKNKRIGIVFNNGKCAYVSKGKMTEIKDTVTLEEMWVQSNILPEMNYDLSRYPIEKDTVTINGVLYNMLSIYSPTYRFLTVNYYNPVTGLLDFIADNYGRVCYYQDYRYFKGFRLPRKAVVVHPDGQQTKLDLVNIELDLPANAALFGL